MKDEKNEEAFVKLRKKCREKSNKICGEDKSESTCRDIYFKKCFQKKLEEYEYEYKNDVSTEHRENKYYDEAKLEEQRVNSVKKPTPKKTQRKCIQKAKSICGQDVECQHLEFKKCLFFKTKRKRISRERHDACRERAFKECGVRDTGKDCRKIYYKHCIKNSPASPPSRQ